MLGTETQIKQEISDFDENDATRKAMLDQTVTNNGVSDTKDKGAPQRTCIKLRTNVGWDTQQCEATMSEGTMISYSGVHVKSGLMIAKFVQDTTSTSGIGKVGEVQVSPMRAHAGSKQ